MFLCGIRLRYLTHEPMECFRFRLGLLGGGGGGNRKPILWGKTHAFLLPCEELLTCFPCTVRQLLFSSDACYDRGIYRFLAETFLNATTIGFSFWCCHILLFIVHRVHIIALFVFLDHQFLHEIYS